MTVRTTRIEVKGMKGLLSYCCKGNMDTVVVQRNRDFTAPTLQPKVTTYVSMCVGKVGGFGVRKYMHL